MKNSFFFSNWTGSNKVILKRFLVDPRVNFEVQIRNRTCLIDKTQGFHL